MKRNKKTVNLFSQYTLDFVLDNIEPAGLRILEVGCGTGEFGLELKKTGAILTALDTDKKAIKSAREKGLDARIENIISFQNDPFDAVIFTRSLHHIHELDKALERTLALVKTGGKLLIEDFDLENIDYKTLRWYYDTLFRFNEAELIEKDGQYIDNPLQEWRNDHHHNPPLNTGTEMIKKVERVFKKVEKYRTPYLFRSICGSIKKERIGYNLAQTLLKMETGLIKDNQILPTGLRIIAQK